MIYIIGGRPGMFSGRFIRNVFGVIIPGLYAGAFLGANIGLLYICRDEHHH